MTFITFISIFFTVFFLISVYLNVVLPLLEKETYHNKIVRHYYNLHKIFKEMVEYYKVRKNVGESNPDDSETQSNLKKHFSKNFANLTKKFLIYYAQIENKKDFWFIIGQKVSLVFVISAIFVSFGLDFATLSPVWLIVRSLIGLCLLVSILYTKTQVIFAIANNCLTVFAFTKEKSKKNIYGLCKGQPLMRIYDFKQFTNKVNYNKAIKMIEEDCELLEEIDVSGKDANRVSVTIDGQDLEGYDSKYNVFTTQIKVDSFVLSNLLFDSAVFLWILGSIVRVFGF